MDRAEAIKAMKSLQDNLGVDRSEENLTTEAATHDKRTETHGVCSDIISRADIEYHTQLEARGNGQYEEVEVAYKSDIDNLPPADTDMSEYSDKLWKAAYERGKAENHQLSKEASTFIDWLLTEVIDEDNWELNAVALGEIICRKLTKMGFLTINDDGCYVRANVKPTDCDDCISREKILEHAYRRDGVMSVAVDAIKLAPSVTPTEGAEELKYMRQRNAELETMLHAQMMLNKQDAIKGGAVMRDATAEEMASVQRYIDSISTKSVRGWIPVSDGLPKVKQEVYVTVYFSEGDTGRAYGYIDGFGNWHLYSAVEGTLFSGYEVTAWMPLPEPYKGGEDE